MGSYFPRSERVSNVSNAARLRITAPCKFQKKIEALPRTGSIINGQEDAFRKPPNRCCTSAEIGDLQNAPSEIQIQYVPAATLECIFRPLLTKQQVDASSSSSSEYLHTHLHTQDRITYCVCTHTHSPLSPSLSLSGTN